MPYQECGPGFDAIYDKLGLNSDRPGVGPRLTQSGMRLLRIGGIETLVIKGYISNIGKEDKEVADIRLQLLDATNFIVQETTNRAGEIILVARREHELRNSARIAQYGCGKECCR